MCVHLFIIIITHRKSNKIKEKCGENERECVCYEYEIKLGRSDEILDL